MTPKGNPFFELIFLENDVWLSFLLLNASQSMIYFVWLFWSLSVSSEIMQKLIMHYIFAYHDLDPQWWFFFTDDSYSILLIKM